MVGGCLLQRDRGISSRRHGRDGGPGCMRCYPVAVARPPDGDHRLYMSLRIATGATIPVH
jgi:hypothetical protein